MNILVAIDPRSNLWLAAFNKSWNDQCGSTYKVLPCSKSPLRNIFMHFFSVSAKWLWTKLCRFIFENQSRRPCYETSSFPFELGVGDVIAEGTVQLTNVKGFSFDHCLLHKPLQVFHFTTRRCKGLCGDYISCLVLVSYILPRLNTIHRYPRITQTHMTLLVADRPIDFGEKTNKKKFFKNPEKSSHFINSSNHPPSHLYSCYLCRVARFHISLKIRVCPS